MSNQYNVDDILNEIKAKKALQNQRKKMSFPSILMLSLFRKLLQQENQKHRYRPFLFRNVRFRNILLKKEHRNLLPVLVPFPDQNLFLLIQ